MDIKSYKQKKGPMMVADEQSGEYVITALRTIADHLEKNTVEVDVISMNINSQVEDLAKMINGSGVKQVTSHISIEVDTKEILKV